MTWTPAAVLRVLELTDTVTIATLRRDERVPAFVWSVRAGDAAYVRSAFGPGSAWYRRARRAGLLFLDVDAAPADTEATPDPQLVTPIPLPVTDVTDPAELARVDAAYRRKYGHDPQNLAPVLSDEARACTLRLDIAAVTDR